MNHLGVKTTEKATVFAIYSHHATRVLLRLYDIDQSTPFHETFLICNNNIWSITLSDLPETYEYVYCCDGPYDPEKGHFFNFNHECIDPYATLLNRSNPWGVKTNNLRGVITPPLPFEWDNDSRPMRHEKDMIVYEMHVRGFTQDTSSGVKHPGTFLGIIEKLPYLIELGINTIELMPIYTFNECELETIDPDTHNTHINFWGYSPINFFTAMYPYGSHNDLKALVKACHSYNIEIILDVVYNHTGKSSSLMGIDNASYYIYDQHSYHNYSGCGNTLNCSHPATMQLIIDSLRHFVIEYHIDGFRFDLASILTRGNKGQHYEHPPILSKLHRDPILAMTKCIAEPWDAAGLYQVGTFPSDRFGEWNDQYRDHIRNFIKGTGDFNLAKQRFQGSPDIYKTPTKSYNFITVHDGFSLHDLVSYEKKYNQKNGENNQDGTNNHLSWNCGEEGHTTNEDILALRNQQMKNFFVFLLLSQGIPIICMGDEYGHSKNGNNNTYCQDNLLNYFNWNKTQFQSLVRTLIDLRIHHLQSIKSIKWLSPHSFICFINNTLLIAFNPSSSSINISLPPKKTWNIIINTYAHIPPSSRTKYTIYPFSSIVLIAT